MPNGINEISPDIRDFLLNRNLILSDTVSNNGLSNIAVGLGSQASIGSSSDAVSPSEDIEVSAIDFRNANVSRNRYTSIEDMVSATLINNSYSYDQIDGGYIDENSRLNIGSNLENNLDIITSITSQEGFGLGENGFYAQNNINTSITGRILGGIGAINDTPLGIIGGQQLLLAFKQRLSFNAQKELFGLVNTQPFSLIAGAEFIKPDYTITIPSSLGGKIGGKLVDLTGFELPTSTLDDGASIFEDDGLFNANSVDRNNLLIRNTGKGQILRLFDILNRNTYKPAYETERGGGKIGITDANDYGPVTDGDTIFIDGVQEADKTWDPSYSPGNGYDSLSSLLTKTKKLFNGDLEKMRVLGGDGEEYDLYNSLFNLQGTKFLSKNSQLNSVSGGRLSKGSGVLSEAFLFKGDKENVFCRTWDSKKSYSTVADLQKNTGLQDNPLRVRNNLESSVLGNNGFVKVSPYNIPSTGAGEADAKKFMFSIENLAWDDNQAFLPEFETGAGDPITGTKGRIMWFPPYDIKFSESTSVNWDKTDFIGRGEPIYTYNNTERSGELSFKIIIDHPDYLNDRNLTSDEVIASITAGCLDYEKYFSIAESNQIQSEINTAVAAGQNTVANSVAPPSDINFYFPNDVATLTAYSTYEGFGAQPPITLPEAGFNSILPSTGYTNSTNYGFNNFWNLPTNITNIKKTLTENEGFVAEIQSYASSAGTSGGNKRLSDARLEEVKTWLTTNISENLTIIKAVSNGSTQATATGDVDSRGVKSERRVIVTFRYEGTKDKNLIDGVEVKKETNNFNKEFAAKIKRRFHKESEYFEKLENSDVKSDKIIYATLKEKIKFFQPAFHSTTPEGFNSRLTFLQQCTRQGETNADTKASNLAFGTPPVCILRIGDFYNTKIVINSLNFTFEPLVWDLNPEGIGVQPMIANVSLAFKFIGGSSLNGPINKLQNAVSFNYFANTEVYDPRADRFIPDEDPKSLTGLKFMSGATDLRAYLDDEDYPSSKDNNVPSLKNQIAESELENSGDPPLEPEGTVTERQKLENISWIIANDSFGFTKLNYTILPLSKKYDLKLEISVDNGKTFNDAIKKQIMESATITSDSSQFDLLATIPIKQNAISRQPILFRLTIKGNGISPVIKNYPDLLYAAPENCPSQLIFKYQLLTEAENNSFEPFVVNALC